MGSSGEKMGEHEEPPSYPDELLHQLCIQPPCRRTPPVLPFPQLQKTLESCSPAFVGTASVTRRAEGPERGRERLEGTRDRDVQLLQDAWTRGTAAI